LKLTGAVALLCEKCRCLMRRRMKRNVKGLKELLRENGGFHISMKD
jgi:hypothetical protein